MKATAPIVELFGPTIQGEGPQTGRRALFIRTGNCNLHCEWCDSWYTWDDDRGRAPETDMTGPQLVDRVNDLAGGYPAVVVLTGGEPLMHQYTDAVKHLVTTLPVGQYPVSVETNGTIPPTPLMREHVQHWSVSPKINPQGDPEKLRLKRAGLQAFASLAREGDAIFKVVVRDTSEVDQALTVTDEHEVPRDRVWLMPEGVNTETIHGRAADIADHVLAAGANLTLRNHVSIWGDKRER